MIPWKKFYVDYHFNIIFYKLLNLRTQASQVARVTGCKGVHPLSRLPGFKSTEEVVPDAMHTIKNVVERIFNLITGRQSTNIETIFKSEQAIGRNYKRVTTVTP